VWEETGLRARVTRLIGVYSDPDQLVIYSDGNKAFFVVLSFEVEVIGGELGLSDETTEAGYFSLAEMDSMPMHGRHKHRVMDALLGQAEALIK
jgi:ADP-ribose pyrophosphatase YjhB (NUDIX family)